MCVTVWVLRYKNKKNGDRGTIVFTATLRRQLFQHEKTQWILSGLIPKRDAQSQHEVAIKHTCLAGETKSFENKVVLS